MRQTSWLQRARLCALMCAWGTLAGSCDEEERARIPLNDVPKQDASVGEVPDASDPDAASQTDGASPAPDAAAKDASPILKPDGAALGDSAMPPPDGAMPPPDSAMPPSDGAMPPPDGAMPPPDGAMPPPDGAMPPPDGAMPPPDGAMPPPDGAMPPPDGAMPPPDSAMPPVDAATDAAPLDGAVSDAQAPADAQTPDATAVDGGACSLVANTYTIGVTNAAGCNLLLRDTSACEAQRIQAGLSGFWLRFSCRVSLSTASTYVQASSDNQPDYKSNYFLPSNVCYEAYTGALQNPNRIANNTVTIRVPKTPNAVVTPQMGAVVGMALNGVAIFGNYAAPGDDIYTEAQTFDRCGAHPQNQGTYHYHSEPYSITQDDSNFLGVMLDGYPIYGRRDTDGTLPSNLDAQGGHTGTTPDSASAVYHYHVNEQTSTNAGTLGQKQWFITKGTYHGSGGTCTTCSM